MNAVINISKATSERRFSVCLDAEETVVGRDASSDICLPFSAVSSSHCRVTLSGEQVFVEDLGSTNGTKLNGQTLQPGTPSIWAASERLEIGDITLELVNEREEIEFDDPESMSRQFQLEPDAEPLAVSVSVVEPKTPSPNAPVDDAEELTQAPQKGMSLASIFAVVVALICFGAAAYGLYWVATL